MEKLIVCIMGQNCERFIKMCLESVKDADEIIYLDGGGTDNTVYFFHEWAEKRNEPKCSYLLHEYNQEDKKMNGKQRNFYLDYLKKNYPNDWVLCVDADEVVEDLSKIKEFIQEAVPGLYHVKMRHFIGNLGQEDATNSEHFGLCRLFKIDCADKYPETEHPVLQPKEGANIGFYRNSTIWHLGYINGIFDINKKYENHLKKSNMHSPEFLKSWKYAHIFNRYPVKSINLLEIPKEILNNFGIDKDEFYFMNRGISVNNFIMVKDWNEYFKPGNILDLGCGLGNYGYVFNKIYGVPYKGIDLSKFAVQTNPYKLELIQGDIIDYKDANKYDLVLCLDILEHLKENELNKALENIQYLGNNYLFSIPYLGDPNLEADSTHQIKQTKEWWIEKINKVFIVEDAPNNWAFSNQILIGKPR